jgi:hypothetical protein
MRASEGVVMDLKSWMSDLEPWLSLIGSLCVVVGTVFVVIQLRMNAKQAASATAFGVISSVTDSSFAARRALLYEVSARYSSGDWTGFDRSREDFEVRNYASIYEQLGLLVQRGLVDLDAVNGAMSAQVYADWSVFEPIRAHIIEESGARFGVLAPHQPGVESIYWPNFKWLAEQNLAWILHKATTPDPSSSPSDARHPEPGAPAGVRTQT